MSRTVRINAGVQDRIRRMIRNSILANAAVIGSSLPNANDQDKARRIAEAVTDDILAEFAMRRRRP